MSQFHFQLNVLHYKCFHNGHITGSQGSNYLWILYCNVHTKGRIPYSKQQQIQVTNQRLFRIQISMFLRNIYLLRPRYLIIISLWYNTLLSPGGLPCPAAAVAIAKAEAGETEQWLLSAVCTVKEIDREKYTYFSYFSSYATINLKIFANVYTLWTCYVFIARGLNIKGNKNVIILFAI